MMGKISVHIASFITLLLLILSACEDPIKVSLEEGESQLIVDGFITFYLDSEALKSGIEKQVIKLRKTAAYFNNAAAPPAIGAKVSVTDALGRTFNFTDNNNSGDYTYTGPFLLSFTNPPLGFPGNFYTLNIQYNNQEYMAQAFMDSVPKLDSLQFTFLPQNIQGPDTLKEGYAVEKILTRYDGKLSETKDIKGEGTCYWFKTYVNGNFYNKPNQMNLAYDAAFGPGSDNVAFIAPIIFGLTPERFDINDEVHIECWSIGLPAYYFMTLAQAQMNNEGLFATPPTNVPTNITNKDKNSKVKAVGYFGAASVSRITQKVK